MNWRAVKEGKHRFKPLRPGLFLGGEMSHEVIFDFSCRYTLPGADQYDINKLFGIGYLPHHHKHSARVGWNYDPELDCIVIHTYVYSYGERKTSILGFVALGKKAKISISPLGNSYVFDLETSNYTKVVSVVCRRPKVRVPYRLGPYFGGDHPAPHEMKIWIK